MSLNVRKCSYRIYITLAMFLEIFDELSSHMRCILLLHLFHRYCDIL